MNITIENNKVIVNLDEVEFPLFEAMFENLDRRIQCSCKFREFDGQDYEMIFPLLPMHLCRTIGEANLSADPFATVSLYPFWKYGFAFGTGNMLALALGIEDAHKKAVAADEFGMGFCAWAMEELFDCDTWADTSTLIKIGAVFPIGTRRPDFVCTFKDGTLGVFEAKGTTGTVGDLTGALKTGKLQTAGIGAQSPIKCRVAVGCALGTDVTRIILLDPPPGGDAKPTNLTADLVRQAAKAMRRPTVGVVRERPEDERAVREPPLQLPGITETIFRGPTAEIALKREEYREEKKHGWLKIE